MLNLALFLGSFTLITLNNLTTSRSARSADHEHQHVASRQDVINSSQQLSEKNETESENNFELPTLILPFFISYFQLETTQPAMRPAQRLAEKTSSPIYVSGCSFRI